MRTIPPALQAKLDSGVTTLARCWIITRRDGVTMGFTDHDQDITLGDVTCHADTGLTASEATARLGLAVDGSEIAGAALDFAGITTLQNLSQLGVGTTADATNPLSAKLNNTLFTAKTVAEGGDGHLRYKMSKESAAKTLSLLLQDNFSGRAEVGLTGDDDLHFKVSADGTTWLDAIVIDKSTGKLTLLGFSNPTATRAQAYAAPFDALAFNGMQVNGAMEISQENGTSAVTLTGSGSLQTKYLLDGVFAAYRGTFVAAAQQVTDAPAGYNNSLKFTVSTAQASIGANDELTIVVPIEGYRVSRLALGTAGASALSFGFWIKAHRTGSYSGAVSNVTPAGGSPRSYPFTFVVNVADTWEFKTVTIATGDTSGSWAKTTAAGLYLTICIAGGSSRVGTAGAWAGSSYSGVTATTNGVAATSDVFQFTGLVVLPGIELPSFDRAPFIMRPQTDERLLVQRYWQTFSDLFGIANSTTAVWFLTSFAPRMRATPSVSLLTNTPLITDIFSSNFSGSSSTIGSTQNVTTDGGIAQVTGFTGLTAGRAYILNGSVPQLAFDARL